MPTRPMELRTAFLETAAMGILMRMFPVRPWSPAQVTRGQVTKLPSTKRKDGSSLEIGIGHCLGREGFAEAIKSINEEKEIW